jgi:hypothetical protein
MYINNMRSNNYQIQFKTKEPIMAKKVTVSTKKATAKNSFVKRNLKIAKKAPTVTSGRQSVTIDGVEYKSRSAAAKELINAGVSLSETAAKVGMTYQTVYAVTKGADKVAQRRIKYRAIKLGTSGKYSESMIAETVGMDQKEVRALMKANEINLPTKADLNKMAKEEEPAPVAAKSTAKSKRSKKADNAEVVAAKIVEQEVLAEEGIVAA